MRRLTFPGFLDRYVRELSAENTGALYSLAREAVHANPRLREPLFLYALSTGRERTLSKAVKGTALEAEFEQIQSRYSYPDLLKALQAVPCDLREGYQKVWRSYQSEANAYERDSRVKALMRMRILALQKEKGISTYRICRDLNLNTANVNAWIKNDDGRKISLPSARKVLEYAEQSAQ